MQRDDILCQICTSNKAKYKCPKCLTPYCTVSCFKKHKSQCKEEIKKSEPILPKRKDKKTNYLSDTIKEKILEDKRLLEILQIPRTIELLKIVQEEGVDTLKSLMYGETPDDIIFQNFAMRLLQAVGLRDSQGVCIL
ncbi:HIT zinc finger protein [Entamoeba histolytica HM-3:IMSS]|uniref:HIT zinc finger protein n=1 Tax=Entamoeba histolytica HM-3:IMSS TaxID=885315 RepID=M7W4G0_ENTHI|nr:HIT zinc finger protein [Entamoeba histolytica HM-3:IMSS]